MKWGFNFDLFETMEHSKDISVYDNVQHFDNFKIPGSIYSRHAIIQWDIFEVKLFNYRGIDFMRPHPSFFSNE